MRKGKWFKGWGSASTLKSPRRAGAARPRHHMIPATSCLPVFWWRGVGAPPQAPERGERRRGTRQHMARGKPPHPAPRRRGTVLLPGLVLSFPVLSFLHLLPWPPPTVCQHADPLHPPFLIVASFLGFFLLFTWYFFLHGPCRSCLLFSLPGCIIRNSGSLS